MVKNNSIRCSTSLEIREMHSEMPCTHKRLAKLFDNKCWQEGREQELSYSIDWKVNWDRHLHNLLTVQQIFLLGLYSGQTVYEL